jgi:hypothetical protein
MTGSLFSLVVRTLCWLEEADFSETTVVLVAFFTAFHFGGWSNSLVRRLSELPPGPPLSRYFCAPVAEELPA